MTETPATPDEAVTFDDICRAALEEATRNKGSALGSDVGADERAAYEAGYDAALARIRTAMGASAG